MNVRNQASPDVELDGARMQELTESFCELCGTRYVFGAAPTRGKSLASARLLARGFKHFVMNDGSSIDESMAAARIETDHEARVRATEEFHRAFNFCMSCRQYACESCWNEKRGACLSCAPREDESFFGAGRYGFRDGSDAADQDISDEFFTPHPADRSPQGIEWPAQDFAPPSRPESTQRMQPGARRPQARDDLSTSPEWEGVAWEGLANLEEAIRNRGAAATPAEPPAPEPTAPAPEPVAAEETEPLLASAVSEQEEVSDELRAQSQSWMSRDDGWDLWPDDQAPVDTRPGAKPAQGEPDQPLFLRHLEPGGLTSPAATAETLDTGPATLPPEPEPEPALSAAAEPGVPTRPADRPPVEQGLTAEELEVIQATLTPAVPPAPPPAAVAPVAAELQSRAAMPPAPAPPAPFVPPQPSTHPLATLRAVPREREPETSAARELEIPPSIPETGMAEPAGEPHHRQALFGRLLGLGHRGPAHEPALPLVEAESTAAPDQEETWPEPTRWVDRHVEPRNVWAEPGQDAEAELPAEMNDELEATEPAIDVPAEPPAPAASAPPKPVEQPRFTLPPATVDPWSAVRSQPPAVARPPAETKSSPATFPWAVPDIPAGRRQAPPAQPLEALGRPPTRSPWPVREPKEPQTPAPWALRDASAPQPASAHKAADQHSAESPLFAELWAESARPVMLEGTVRVCYRCSLPLSTHARFCRRCGTRQD